MALARVGMRLAGWPRRLAAIGLLVAAVLVGLRPDRVAGPVAPPPPTTPVVVAARDLAAGSVLTGADLRTVPMPDAVLPAGAARSVAGLAGRVAAGPMRRGEPVTDARVVGPGLTAGLPVGSAAVPVRLAEPETATLVRAGDRVDVLGAPVGPDGTGTGDAVEIATGVRVLAVLAGQQAADGAVLVVAAAGRAARALAGAAARHRITVTVHPP